MLGWQREPLHDGQVFGMEMLISFLQPVSDSLREISWMIWMSWPRRGCWLKKDEKMSLILEKGSWLW